MGKLLKGLCSATLVLAGTMGMAETKGRATIRNDSKVPWEVWHETLWQDKNLTAFINNEDKEPVAASMPACLAFTVRPGETLELVPMQQFPGRFMRVSFRRENPIYFNRATFTLHLDAGEEPRWDLKGTDLGHFVRLDGPRRLRLVDPRFTGPRRRMPGIQKVIDQLDPKGGAVRVDEVVERKEEWKGDRKG